jgi:serine/threonine-protein kinase
VEPHRVPELLTRLTQPLANRYAFERELGRGGMATVFLARDVVEDREVAVKVLHADLTVAVGAERFRREISIARQLHHPHILPLYDSGEAAGSLYYTMPHVSGESLRARIAREQQLPVEEAVRIAREVASALDYAHAQGVVHRDIKPENILLDLQGRSLVADFGIARAVSAWGGEKLTQTGVTLGTPAYMSPEQAFAEREIDGRSDIYSLGCVLFEMLAGQPPFTGPNAQAVMARHTMEVVPSITIVRQSVPDAVEDAILCAMGKSPADRFATAAEFAKALELPEGEGRERRRTTPGGARVERRRLTPQGTRVERRRSKVRRWLYAATAALPLLGGAWAGWRFYVQPAKLAAAPAPGAADGGLDPNRIAVLYFDEKGAGGVDYLADALTESLIAELGGVKALDVVSRNGVTKYRGAKMVPASIARELEAGTLVGGSVEDRGSRIAVRVRVSDGNTGAPVGDTAFTYPKDLFVVRDSLAEHVSRFLRRRIGSEIRLRERKTGTRSVEAWTLVQRAEKARKAAEARLAADSVEFAARDFGAADSLLAAAAAADPAWAEPLAARALLAFRMARLSANEKTRAGALIDNGLAYANAALETAPGDAAGLEARGSLRYLRYLLQLDPGTRAQEKAIAAAEDDLKLATKADPARASAWSTLSHLYFNKPSFVDAQLAAQRAYEADAYLDKADEVLWRLYLSSYDLEQFDNAAKWCGVGAQRFPANPRFVTCQLRLLQTRVQRPDVEQAWQLYRRFAELTPRAPEAEWEIGTRDARIWVAAVIARAAEQAPPGSLRTALADSADRVLVRARGTPQIDPDLELLWPEAYVRILLNQKDEAVSLLKRYLSANPAHRAGMAHDESWLWRGLRDYPPYRELVGAVQ